MLTSKGLGIAETVVLDVKHDVAAEASPLVGALNSAACGLVPVTCENYMTLVPENTRNPEYVETMKELSTVLAENIRATFEQISVYGKGVANAITKEINCSDSGFGSQGVAMRHLMDRSEFNFVRVDHEFFSSLIYPVKEVNGTQAYNEISADSISKVKFASWADEDIIKWLDIDNKEINQLLLSPSADLRSALQGLGYADNLPFHYDYDTKSIDFTKPRLRQIERLFIQYVLLCKMVATEEPFEGITQGSLQDYRNHVSFLHGAYTHGMLRLKQVCSSLSAQPINIVELEPAAVVDAVVESTGTTFQIVKVKADIYYNKAGLEFCANSQLPLAELAVAYFHKRYVGLEPSTAASMVNNFEATKLYNQRLVNAINEILGKNRASVLKAVLMKAITAFLVTRPELVDQVTEGTGTTDVSGWVSKFIDDTECNHSLAWEIARKGITTADAVFASGIPAKFLGSLGCDDACKVLRLSVSMGDDSSDVVDRRKTLHKALIHILAEKTLRKGK